MYAIDEKLIQDLKNNWRNTNNASASFLQSIPNQSIQVHPFENRFTDFSWEFSCLIRTRLCYLEELKTGIQNFEDREGIPNKDILQQKSKKELADLISETSNALLEEITKIDTYNKVARIIWLLQHERIHQGKLLLYHSKLNLEIPESFKKTWGESNF